MHGSVVAGGVVGGGPLVGPLPLPDPHPTTNGGGFSGPPHRFGPVPSVPQWQIPPFDVKQPMQVRLWLHVFGASVGASVVVPGADVVEATVVVDVLAGGCDVVGTPVALVVGGPVVNVGAPVVDTAVVVVGGWPLVVAGVGVGAVVASVVGGWAPVVVGGAAVLAGAVGGAGVDGGGGGAVVAVLAAVGAAVAVAVVVGGDAVVVVGAVVDAGVVGGAPVVAGVVAVVVPVPVAGVVTDVAGAGEVGACVLAALWGGIPSHSARNTAVDCPPRHAVLLGGHGI